MSEARPWETEDLSGCTELELTMAGRFVGQRCVLDPKLVSPMRSLWSGFVEWGREHRVAPSAVALRAVLAAAPWASVCEVAGRGRIRCLVMGVGLRARPPR